MEHGQLLVKTDYTKGTLTINWEKIERVESKQLFVLETEQGNYYSGEIRTDAKESQNVDVTLGGTQTVLRQKMVVTMEQLGRRGFIALPGAVAQWHVTHTAYPVSRRTRLAWTTKSRRA